VVNPVPPDAVTKTWDTADRVASEFEDALNRSERPSIRAELERVGPDARERLFNELARLEIAYRRGKSEGVDPDDDEPVFSESNELDELDDRIERAAGENPSPAPKQIGRYKIVATLGRGGQAQTFRVIHPGFKTTAVLKLAHKSPDPARIARIATEGRLLASLPAHRHLVKIHDVDFYEGRVFLVLEDVAGQTLDHYVKDRHPEPTWAARTVAAIARAVHVAHEQGITHQDLKPANVLIDREGQPRVIDFGVAWSRPWWADGDAPASIGGTPNYFAPEQARWQSDQIGRGTDVFGLGGILFFLLSGKPLYTGENQRAVWNQAREMKFDAKLLDRRSVRPRLRAICLKALAEQPQDRFPTAADLATALDRFAAPRRWPFRALLASLFLLSFGLAWAIQHYRHAGQAATVATSQPSLQVRIWRPDSQFQPLLEALPVHSGDELQIQCHVPRGQTLTLCLVNASGNLQTLAHYPAQEDDRDTFYPTAGKTSELKGQPGTEMVLAIRRTDGNQPAPGEVEQLWQADAAGAAWPALKPSVVVRLRKDGVEFEGEHDRDLGATRDRTDPQERVRQRLDAFRMRLSDQYSYYEGVAFGHE
jgi:eukaryotic-like serine/threonine-protein kinase